MPNKTLFATQRGKQIKDADTVNEAGGAAYQKSDKHALAQYAVTGCLNQTFYASAPMQLAKVLDLCGEVDPGFIAKCAVYARNTGHMKDMPAVLLANLFSRPDGLDLFERVFPQVIDNGRMLRGFVQIVRSGVTGRKSFGRAGLRTIRKWLAGRTDEQLFRDSVGNDPSLADVIKMVHPKPSSPERTAMYGYLLGKEHDVSKLPELVRHYELYKANPMEGVEGLEIKVPNVPFQMLDSLGLGTAEWTEIAKNARWMMTRMNLNTFLRHGVFDQDGMTKLIADRLSDPDEVRGAKAFPYQLLAAYMNVNEDVPHDVKEALQDAMEIAVENVPEIPGNVYVALDVSGSMRYPATGYRQGSTSKVSCVDVAALIAAAIVRKNPTAKVLPFTVEVHESRINPRDSVVTNARIMSSYPAGGTNCSAPLALLNKRKADVDAVIFASDSESWVETCAEHGGPLRGYGGYGPTQTMREWETLKSRNPDAVMACIDIAPYDTSQVSESARGDILQVGGFSDSVFKLVADFVGGNFGQEHWIKEIEAITV
jgi:60 kDa SS-A/Ro ribonucleoprotein